MITGASAGIGKASAEVFAEHGYDLVLAARRAERLEAIKRELEAKHGVAVSVFPVDLAGIEGPEKLHAAVASAGIRVDVLVNNAGVGVSGDFADIDIERETDMLMLNMVALTRLTKLFVCEMVERKSGRIVNIASTASFQPIPGFASYAATKAYVLSFSEALAFELRAHNVKVTAVCPGATESEFAKTAGIEGAAMFSGAPDSRALGEFVYRSTLAGRPVAVHGFKNLVMAKGARFMPRRAVLAVAAKLTSAN